MRLIDGAERHLSGNFERVEWSALLTTDNWPGGIAGERSTVNSCLPAGESETYGSWVGEEIEVQRGAVRKNCDEMIAASLMSSLRFVELMIDDGWWCSKIWTMWLQLQVQTHNI